MVQVFVLTILKIKKLSEIVKVVFRDLLVRSSKVVFWVNLGFDLLRIAYLDVTYFVEKMKEPL